MRFDELVNRVRDTLIRLETLSEGKVNAQQFEASGPTHASKDAELPAGDRSSADYFADRLERWCEQAERRIRDECQGQANSHGQLPDLNNAQVIYWVTETYQGVDYRTVAEHEGLHETVVWKMREKRGFEGRKGLPKPDSKAA